GPTGYLLYALADVGDPALYDDVRAALCDPESTPTSALLAGLDLVGDDDGFVAEAWDLLDHAGHFLDDELWAPCAAYLLRVGADRGELMGRLLAGDTKSYAVAGAVALGHRPRRAPGLLRRAMRSGDDDEVSIAVAALALADRPWSRRELA